MSDVDTAPSATPAPPDAAAPAAVPDAYAERVAAALAPLSDDAPAGADLTYDSTFEWVKAEIDRMNAVDIRIDQERALQGEGLVGASAGLDFARVAEACWTLLAERTKDLRAGGYLTVALYETDGVTGLAAGLHVLAGLCERYWATMYPPRKRLRGRLAALTFAGQHLARGLEASPPAPPDRPVIASARAALDALQAALDAHVEAPLRPMLGVEAALDEALRRLPGQPLPEPDASPAVAPPAADASPPTEAPSGDADSTPTEAVPPRSEPAPRPVTPSPALPSAPARTPTEALRAVVQACAVLRDARLASPTPFRLARALRWDDLVALPPHNDGRTRVQPPPARRLDYLRGLAERGDWIPLIAEGEATFTEHPYQFWLDLQRLLTTAFEGAGPDYAAARAAVVAETNRLAARLPALARLAYSDGTPFADAATQRWLEEHAVAQTDARPISRGASVPPDDEALGALLGEARRQATTGDLAEGIRLLGEAAARADSGRGRFVLRLAQARLFAGAGRPEMARPILDALARDAERLGLERWEPALALDLAAEQCRCLAALEQRARGEAPDRLRQLRDDREAAFDRLCRLDAHLALVIAIGHSGPGNPSSQT